MARPRKRIGLRRPHLVLADVGGDDRVVRQESGGGADDSVRLERVVHAGHYERIASANGIDVGAPTPQRVPRATIGAKAAQRVADISHRCRGTAV